MANKRLEFTFDISKDETNEKKDRPKYVTDDSELLRDYLSSPDVVNTTSDKHFSDKFPAQQRLDCVANAVANGLCYLENIDPYRKIWNFNESITTHHKQQIRDFLEQTEQGKTNGLRTLDDVEIYLAKHFKDVYETEHIRSATELIKKLFEARGSAIAIIIPYKSSTEDISHATMLYVRRNSTKNSVEIIEIDSLSPQEKLLSSDEIVQKLYPDTILNNNAYSDILWMGPYYSCIVISEKPLDMAFKKRKM